MSLTPKHNVCAENPLILMASKVDVVKSARHKLQQIQHTKLNIINKSPDDVDFYS